MSATMGNTKQKKALDPNDAPNPQSQKRQRIDSHPPGVNSNAHSKARDESSEPSITSRHILGPEDYTVGWVCALTAESIAAQTFLEEKHPDLASQENDNNCYTLGRIGPHNVVIACLPYGNYGLDNATNAAKDMLRTFTNVRLGLMVGIGGGVPTIKDVRLGDVVVSSVDGEKGAVYQYDFGKTTQNRAFQTTRHLDAPPLFLQTAVGKLREKYEMYGNQIEADVLSALERYPRLRRKYGRPDPASDRLYKKTFVHPESRQQDCASICGLDEANLIIRRIRSEDDDNTPEVHYGLIASANNVMKDATLRDRLAEEKGVLCFEMEAAGLMNYFKCLVIRGICDYSDSHKNDSWQGYAAMTAAAYTKDLLNTIPPTKVQAESRIILDIHDTVQEIQTQTQQIISKTRSDDIRKWLSPSDPSANYTKALKQRHERTGQWLLDSTVYRCWKEAAKGFLWLNGKPGCGKTILSSTLIEDLKQSDAGTILYFYFDFSDTTKQTVESMVRSLVYQLYYQVPGVQVALDSLYASCNDGKSQPRSDSLIPTFQSMLQTSSCVRIVLDALDECSTRGEVLDWIQHAQKNPHTCIVATSRPEQEIEASIGSWATPSDIVPLHSKLDTDINQFIRARVHTHTDLSRWQGRPQIQAEIESTLRGKADGMFRWVTCQLDALKTCLAYPELRQALRELPMSLDETYNRILKQIPTAKLSTAKRILQFLTYSKRPMSIAEVVDAVTVSLTENPRFDEGNRLPIPDEIARYCSSLVTIIDKKYESGVVRKEMQLSHYSVKEWLVSDRLDVAIAKDFQETYARAILAQVCVAYLIDLNQDLPVKDITNQYPLAVYSAQYWAEHAAVGETATRMVVAIAMEIFQNVKAYELIWKLFDPYDDWADQDDYRESRPPLYLAAYKGLEETTRQLLENSAHTHAQDGLYRNAMQAASSGGHEEIVKLFLDNGADINAPGGAWGTALQTASAHGHGGVVKLLIDNGADINALGGKWGTALYIASAQGYEGIVKLLLDNGADVHAQAEYSRHILELAVWEGHEGIVKLLLDNGADVNAQGDALYVIALKSAVWKQQEGIVKLLLEKGADVNAETEGFGHIMEIAMKRGHKGILKLLRDSIAAKAMAP